MTNGLIGVDLARCWISWSILPRSQRSGLMCEYTDSVDDPLRHSRLQLSGEEITEVVRKILNEPEQSALEPACFPSVPPTNRQL